MSITGWVITDGRGFYERGTGCFVLDLERAASFPCKQEVWSRGHESLPFGQRADGKRFLLPTAPAIDQPSPYSDTDAPIPYRPRRSAYVAAALPQKAHASRFARQLEAAGVLVTSTWHETDATPQIESAMPDEQRAEVAERCLQEVDAADTFVWLHGGACGRIGAIVEYGYALGRGKDVYLVPLDGLEIGSVFGAISPVAAPGDVVRALAEVAP